MKVLMRRVLSVAASLALVLMLTAGFCTGTLQEAYAADSSYGTENFDVTVDVNEDNSYNITESIVVDFYYPHHGIYRYIPENGSRVNKVKVPGYDFSTYTESGNLVIKIGSADYTVYGEYPYDIYYEMQVYDDSDTSKDYMLLNVIPTDWETPIDEATATITLPKEADLSDVKVYSGRYGTEENEDNVQLETSSDGRTVTVKVTDLPANHGVTVGLDLPEGYWVGALERGGITPGMIILFLLGPVGIVALWWMYGRDKEMIKTIEFYPPEGITPGEIGFVIDGIVNERDLLSSIVYMADKGYLTIKEIDRKEFILYSVTDPSDDEPKYIHTIYDGLFGTTGRRKDSVRTTMLGTTFGTRYMRARKELRNMFTGTKSVYKSTSVAVRILGVIAAATPVAAFGLWSVTGGDAEGFFGAIWGVVHVLIATVIICYLFDTWHTKNPVTRILLLIAGVVVLLFGLLVTVGASELLNVVSPAKGLAIVAALILGTIVSIVFAVLALARKDEYTDLMGKILGFRDFIRTAELDKLNELVEQDPEYFYHIIPYAYVMGLTNKWIKKFENIEIVQPQWINTRFDSFDAYMMGRMMSDCSASMSHNIVLPDTGGGGGGFHSGGGFSGGGGGFSGGGFGGGGGGAW